MIISTCIYLEKNESFLLLDRNKKANDVNHGKMIGVGGKKIKDETIEQCVVRETKEETGYDIESLHYCGSVLFLTDKDEELIYVFRSSKFGGEEISCDEGDLSWVPVTNLFDCELWEGDRIFLKEMIDHPEKTFSFIFTYDADGNLIKNENLGAI